MGCKAPQVFSSHSCLPAGLRNMRGKCSAFPQRGEKETHSHKTGVIPCSSWNTALRHWAAPDHSWKVDSAGKQRDISFTAFKESFINSLTHYLQPRASSDRKIHLPALILHSWWQVPVADIKCRLERDYFLKERICCRG